MLRGQAQRVIVTVGIGFVALAVGVYLMFLGQPAHFRLPAGFPSGHLHVSESFASDGVLLAGPQTPVLSPWEDLLVWIGLIALWTALGLRLLRPDPQRTRTARTAGPDPGAVDG